MRPRTTGRLPARIAGVSLLLAAALGSGGCETGAEPDPVPPVTLRVVPDSATLSALGDTLYLEAVLERDGDPVEGPVRWRSRDTAVVRVDSSGTAISVRAGEVQVEAWSEHDLELVSDTAFLTVVDPEPAIFTSVAAMPSATCGIDRGGAAFCWGDDSDGQLGAGYPAPQQCGPYPCSSIPLPVAGGHVFQEIVGGGTHACGITAEGAYCWGSNWHGQLGTETALECPQAPSCLSRAPVPVAGDLHFERLALGSSHTCGLTAEGVTYCWGYNEQGELGTGSEHTCGSTECSRTPVAVDGLPPLRDLAAGGSATYGLTEDGVVYVWGRFLGTAKLPPTVLPSDDRLVEIHAGLGYLCGLTATGTALCAGANHAGTLGDGTPVDRDRLAPIAGDRQFTSITAGAHHACGVTEEPRSIHCWGKSSGLLEVGQECNPARNDCYYALPVELETSIELRSVSGGSSHTCARAADGGTYCWGRNTRYALGNAVVTFSREPLPVRPPEE